MKKRSLLVVFLLTCVFGCHDGPALPTSPGRMSCSYNSTAVYVICTDQQNGNVCYQSNVGGGLSCVSPASSRLDRER